MNNMSNKTKKHNIHMGQGKLKFITTKIFVCAYLNILINLVECVIFHGITYVPLSAISRTMSLARLPL